MRPEHFTFFAGFIESETGIIYSESNSFQLENRLESIASQLGCKNLDELYTKAREGIQGEFRQLLVDVATNNETSFFRDPRVFSAIEESLLPTIRAAQPGKKIRIWSAACSFGQEPYTLAIIARQLMKKGAISECEIWATDIARKAINKASDGRYTSLEVERGLSNDLRTQYFTNTGENEWTVRSELRSLVKFEGVNLLKPIPPNGTFDLVLCRNILIYQRVENKTRIVRSLSERMSSGSYLILGAGESLIGVSTEFEQVNVGGIFLYRRK